MNIPDGYALVPRELYDDLLRRAEKPLSDVVVPSIWPTYPTTFEQPYTWNPNTCGGHWST